MNKNLNSKFQIINEINSLFDKQIKTELYDVSYKTKKNFKINLKIENTKELIKCDEKSKINEFSSLNISILRLLYSYKMIPLSGVYNPIPIRLGKYSLIERYEKEILTKETKMKLPKLMFLDSNINVFNVLVKSSIFNEKKELNNILILNNNSIKINNINDIQLDNFYAHILVFNKYVKYNQADLFIVDSGTNITGKKETTIKFRELYRKYKDKIMKVIDKYNENLKSIKAKYQINYSCLYDPNEILKLSKKTKKYDYIYGFINIRIKKEPYIINNNIKNHNENKSMIYTIISELLVVLATQEKKGDCLLSINYLKEEFVDQIIFILNKYYETVEIINDPLAGFFSCRFFIIGKNFNGISKVDFNKLLNLQKQLFEYDNTAGILTSNNDDYITNLFDINEYEKKSNLFFKNELKKIKLTNDLGIKFKKYFESLSYKDKIQIHEDIINLQYFYGIDLCNELNIPLNPVINEYIKKMEETNSDRLFQINLYNVKKVQKIKEKINYKDNIDDLIKKRELEIEEGSLDQEQIKFFKNLLIENNWIRHIGEIGFNVGVSSDNFLKFQPFCNVVSFDIVLHDYVYDAKEFMDKKYPQRHLLIGGDSKISVPYFFKKFPKYKFDLIFIDGDHSFYGAKQDIINMRKLSHKRTIMVFDDILPNKSYGSGPTKAWEYCIKNKIIKNAKVITFSKDKAIGICNYV